MPPLHSQIEAQIREAIRAGISVREPSCRRRGPWPRNWRRRGVVVESYAQLRAEGYLEIRGRGKTAVSPVAAGAESPAATPAIEPDAIRYDFHPGLPDLDSFPRAAWSRALRNSIRDLPGRELGYGDLRGVAALRERARHPPGPSPRRGRFPRPAADHAGLLAGAVAGLRGAEVAWRPRRRGRGPLPPDPPRDRRVSRPDPVPSPSTKAGCESTRWKRTGSAPRLVTPAHQFPSGVVLAPDRRAALVEWARRHDAFVIEDDYDAEYRYDRGPVGALQGLAPERVVYGGSASKTLAPALRVGWLLLPDELLAPVVERKALAGQTPTLDQLALAELIAGGEFHRHLRRMRRRYRDRRDAIVAALAEHLPEARVEGIAAGLHVVAHLPAGTDETRLVAAAYRARSRRFRPRLASSAP